jgi:quercetin dioxygenase-like cupin family protein
MIGFITRRAAVMAVVCAMASAVSAEELTLGGTYTVLSRADLTGVAGMEVIVSSFSVKPGGVIPRHTHPGDEHYRVVQGTKLTRPDGKIFEIKDGTAKSYSRDVAHAGVTNTGDRDFILTVVLILDKDKPMFTIVK